MKGKILLIIAVLILLIGAGFAYWYFMFNGADKPDTTGGNGGENIFTPFQRNPGTVTASSSNSNNQNTYTSTSTTNQNLISIPKLRMLSDTPIGGYGASTTASTTIIRWIDRGRGNILETKSDDPNTTVLSNTLLPRVYESIWNKNLNAFIGSILSDKNLPPTLVYSEMLKQTNSTSTTPFMLRGKNISEGMIGYAASPNGDRVFIMINENGQGVGYIANFDGSKMTKLFETPVTQVNVEWPESETIAITTKGISTGPGFLYFVNTKTGVWKRILGPINGLSTKVSHDAKSVFMSSSAKNGGIDTAIYTVATGKQLDAIVRTLADKCTWGNFYKNLIYCAASAQPVSAVYPDDWYSGKLSLNDKIWSINATNAEVHLISSIVDESDRLIDAFTLNTDKKDQFLFFMNKNDLSFWSLDLVSSN